MGAAGRDHAARHRPPSLLDLCQQLGRVSVDYPVTRGEVGRLRSGDGSSTFDSNSLEGLRQAMTAGNPRVSGNTFTMNCNPPTLAEARRFPWLAGGSQAVAPQSTPFGSRLTTPRERTEPGRVGPGGTV